MTKMKLWLRNSNGWQRLWFVGSAIGLFYVALINPIVMTADNVQGRFQYKSAVEREMKNSACATFIVRPFAELAEPPYVDFEGNSGCYHIYNFRKFHNAKTFPYTQAQLNSDYARESWSDLLVLSGIGVVLAVLLSALIYIVGKTVAWISNGFKFKRIQ